MLIHRWAYGLTLVIGLMAGSALVIAADDDAKKPAAAADDKSNSTDEDAAKEKKDRFALPEGGAKDLLAFLKELMTYRPRTREQILSFQLRGRKAMKEAAEKLLEIATDEDKKLEGFEDVEPLLLMFRGQQRDATPEEQAKLVEDIKAYLARHESPSRYAMTAARQAASAAEYTDPERAAQLYREFGTIFARSKDPQIARQGETMVGAARRLTLIGQPLELSGTLMDGEKFDWAKYRGKVVLVDFWATWCAPCRAEIPNVKKNYELYHDKGFEVVGISLDNDRAALEKFLETEGNPWITVYDGPWSENAVATYYGVFGIPTVILVDKEGKVVSTRARGPELGRLLEELLGPAEPKEPSATGEKTEVKTEGAN